MIVGGHERADVGSYFDVLLMGKSQELGGKIAAQFLVRLDYLPTEPDMLAHAMLHEHLASSTYALGNGGRTVLDSLRIEPDYILGSVNDTELPGAVLSFPGYHLPVELRSITAQ